MKNLRLKAARAGLDMSQDDLAKKVGVSIHFLEVLETIHDIMVEMMLEFVNIAIEEMTIRLVHMNRREER